MRWSRLETQRVLVLTSMRAQDRREVLYGGRLFGATGAGGQNTMYLASKPSSASFGAQDANARGVGGKRRMREGDEK
jgi:hypothetical protein